MYRHLLDIEHVVDSDIALLLETATEHLERRTLGAAPPSSLQGKTVVQFFFEPSTRTRTSFEMAAKELGAYVITVNGLTSSVKKGETLEDTISTLAAMGADVLVIRHPDNEAANVAASLGLCHIINAGTGTHAHPTQALLDALAMRQAFGRLEGLEVALCGDIRYSRVARSNMVLLRRMGAKIRLIAPETLLPEKVDPDVMCYSTMEEGLKGVQVVMMLRLQKERMQKARVPDEAAFFEDFGLTEARLQHADDRVCILHPGPVNRDVEIASALVDDPRSLILQQVACGVAMRQAVLEWVLQRP